MDRDSSSLYLVGVDRRMNALSELKVLDFSKNQQAAEDNSCNSNFASTRTSRVELAQVE